jgi:hypothetical protein
MAATVLNGPRALQMGILVVHAFLRALRQLLAPVEAPRRRRIGFTRDEEA